MSRNSEALCSRVSADAMRRVTSVVVATASTPVADTTHPAWNASRPEAEQPRRILAHHAVELGVADAFLLQTLQ